MKILLTGMTSQHCSVSASEKQHSVSWLLKQALTELGHEVDHRNPTLSDTADEYDKVLLGLGPLHGMGTNRMYGALSVLARAEAQDKLIVYLDDPNVWNTLGGFKVMRDDPNKLCKEFFRYKLEWDQAREPTYRNWLQSVVERMCEYAWPRVIAPSFAWTYTADAEIKKHVPQIVDLCEIDPTALYPQTDAVAPTDEVERVWVAESAADDRWLRAQQLLLPLNAYGPRGLRRPADGQLAEIYRRSWGALSPPVKPSGWWYPTLLRPTLQECPVATDWRFTDPLGAEWQLLPGSIESMDERQRADLAIAQRAKLLSASPDRQAVIEQIGEIVK